MKREHQARIESLENAFADLRLQALGHREAF